MFIEIETANGRRIVNSAYIISVEPRETGCALLLASGGNAEELTIALSYDAVLSGLRIGGVDIVTRQPDEAAVTTLRPVGTD